MQYIVVEIKNNDLYTIYDPQNKGVCCCSLYTIRQLMDANCSVVGAEVKNGRLRVSEMSLDGKQRSQKAPVMCEDTTKRSATTILKGLDEKHYPRIIHKRVTDSTVYPIGSAFILHGKTGDLVCVSCDDKHFISENMKVHKFSEYPISAYGEKYTIDAQVCKEMLSCFKQKMANLQLTEQIKQLQEKQVKLSNQITHTDYTVKQSIAKAKFETALELKKNEVNGNETFNVSFTRGYDAAFVCAVLLKTKRPIRYTYGLSYRNPTTNKVLIPVEKAVACVRKGGFVDVRAEKDCIYINEYSENDML